MANPIDYATPQPARRPNPVAFWLLYSVGGARGGLFIACVALVVVAMLVGLGASLHGKRFVPLVGLAIGVLVPPVIFGILLAL